jgi:hypothetical protein
MLEASRSWRKMPGAGDPYADMNESSLCKKCHVTKTALAGSRYSMRQLLTSKSIRRDMGCETRLVPLKKDGFEMPGAVA